MNRKKKKREMDSETFAVYLKSNKNHEKCMCHGAFEIILRIVRSFRKLLLVTFNIMSIPAHKIKL